ncbi:UNVERIFIED_ORG: MSHA pilin protein MshA [Idiomarina abyssalis]|uniref:prepilin-type N-terminal cleavage/methylation domain-containing protein n=1 Tax=Idiomarina sp. 017G TaxID=2183988 RepID=UPI000C6AA926|nr:prepilin-type N-terminal cleavage/methylation domain-containing protein [Idiomarina sp. 017G]MAA62869.1 Type II secretory pathway, pseudopilin [Idiomarina sp.]TDO48788.1 MSHA pilin protein MshA [Idiomarina sp. 017G]
MRNQKGFTLIELIIVIVVLGILAVTAAPQFINFSTDARTSTVKGLKGALQGAAQTVYAKAAIDDDLDGTSATPVPVNGVATVNGYPAASADGIVKAASLGAYDTAGSSSDPAVPFSSEDWVYTVVGTTIYIAPAESVDDTSTALSSDGDCQVNYANAADANTPPAITIDTSGC